MKPYEIGYLEYQDSDDIRDVLVSAESAVQAARWFKQEYPDYIIISIERMFSYENKNIQSNLR